LEEASVAILFKLLGKRKKSRCLLLASEAVNGLLFAMWQIDLKCLLDRLASLLRLLLL